MSIKPQEMEDSKAAYQEAWDTEPPESAPVESTDPFKVAWEDGEKVAAAGAKIAPLGMERAGLSAGGDYDSKAPQQPGPAASYNQGSTPDSEKGLRERQIKKSADKVGITIPPGTSTEEAEQMILRATMKNKKR